MADLDDTESVATSFELIHSAQHEMQAGMEALATMMEDHHDATADMEGKLDEIRNLCNKCSKEVIHQQEQLRKSVLPWNGA